MNVLGCRPKSWARTLALGVALAAAAVVVASDAPTPPVTPDNVQADPDAKRIVRDNPVAELVKNPGFEAEELKGWSLIAAGGAQGKLEREATTRKGETNSHALRLTVMSPGQRCGVSNHGVAGVNVRAGNWYDLTFQARTEKRENDRGYGLTASLESPDDGQVFARTTLPEVGGDWNGYTVALHARVSNPKARLVITMSEPGTIWLDDVSLSARGTDDGQKQ